MRKIINGKLYNTDSAHRIDVASFSNPRDFHYWEETLYQKKTGEFFLYGEGGPMTKYAVSTGLNQWRGGEKIIPLDVEGAQKWVEDHSDDEVYERLWGKIPEDDTKKAVTFYLSVGTAEKLKRLARDRGCSVGDVIENLLN